MVGWDDAGSAVPHRERDRLHGGAAGEGCSAAANVLVLGDGQLAEAATRALRAGGAVVVRLEDPNDREVREAVDEQTERVVVISRSDHVALRRALVVAHLRPGLPMLVTIFDHHVAAEVQSTVRNANVLSMADLVAPAFAGPCLDPDLMALVRRGGGVEGVEDDCGAPRHASPRWSTPSRARRVWSNLEALLRPFDASARILVYGLAGFLLVLLVETLVMALGEGVPFVEALYSAAKVAVTVGPSPVTDRAGSGLKVFSAVAMLLALGFTAVLTAGLVNRLLDARLTGIVGRAAVPRRDHVIVVGLGQVGHRLCELLRDLHVPVVAVDSDPEATNITRAKDRRLPVVIGDGADHRTLRRLSIRTARALAAVTSDEVENIAVAVAARRIRSDLNIALRAGDGDATSETQSLFHIGVVRDVYRIAGSALAAATLGYEVHHAFPHQHTMYLVDGSGDLTPFKVVSP